MDKSPFGQGEVAPEIITALGHVVSLLLGWYPKVEYNKNTINSWGFLLRDLDSALFIPATEVWGKTHPDWPPTAPQFRQMVEQLQQERIAEEVRHANARIIEISKAAGRRNVRLHPSGR